MRLSLWSISKLLLSRCVLRKNSLTFARLKDVYSSDTRDAVRKRRSDVEQIVCHLFILYQELSMTLLQQHSHKVIVDTAGCFLSVQNNT